MSNILSRTFNFVLDPEVSSAAAKDIMPEKDDSTIDDIATSFQQLYSNIKMAGANRDSRPLADSTPPTFWLAAKRTGQTWPFRPAPSQQPARHGRERGNSHSDRPPHDNTSSNNRGGSNSNATPINQSKGILVRIDANKGIGVDNLTPVPSFSLKGQNRELCLKVTRGCLCTYGNKCNKFHLTEKQFLSFEPAKQAKLDKLVSSLNNIAFADGLAKTEREGSKSKNSNSSNNNNNSEGSNSALQLAKTKKGRHQPQPPHKVRHK
jgi:hypothetical protein